MAERLGSGLQIRVGQFDSDWVLQKRALSSGIGLTDVTLGPSSLCGGMAYTAVSKTAALTGLWVRIPPKAPNFFLQMYQSGYDSLDIGISDS